MDPHHSVTLHVAVEEAKTLEDRKHEHVRIFFKAAQNEGLWTPPVKTSAQVNGKAKKHRYTIKVEPDLTDSAPSASIQIANSAADPPGSIDASPEAEYPTSKNFRSKSTVLHPHYVVLIVFLGLRLPQRH